MTQSENRPLVSIGMPVYNGEQLIQEALESLLSQDFKDFELIISDNASTDATAEICQMYATRDSRIRYYRNENNIGPTANFNRLVHLACGNYFMWAAYDDLWEPSYISHMVDALDNNLKAVLAFCDYDTMYIYNKSSSRYTGTWTKMLERDDFLRLVVASYKEPIETTAASYIYGLIRKDILLKCGGMESRVNAYKGADLVTIFHLLYYGPFVKVNSLLFHKRYDSPNNRIESSIQKLSKQSFFSLIISYLKYMADWHSRYNLSRQIVRKFQLSAPKKIILLAVYYTSELRYYIRNVKINLTILYRFFKKKVYNKNTII